MDSSKPGPRPHTTRPTILPRQLTIGECIAIGRYADPLYEGERQARAVHTVLDFIDSLQVCTTCGWPELEHRASRQIRTEIRCCAHWTRKL